MAIAKDLLYPDFTAESDYKNSLIINSTNQDALANYAYFLIDRNRKKKACVLIQNCIKLTLTIHFIKTQVFHNTISIVNNYKYCGFR